MGKRRTCVGQSTAEYAVVIALVLAAAIGMQTYIKRTLQARYKKATQTLTSITPLAAQTGDFGNWSALQQYEPYYAKSDITTERKDNFQEVYDKGKTTRTGVLSQSDRQVGGFQEESDATKLAQDDSWR